MYTLIKAIEYVFHGIYIKVKTSYYKLKYGKRLRIGKHLRFRSGFRITIEKNGYLKIGDDVFFNHDCAINVQDSIDIGDHNLFGEGVKLYDHNHVFDEDQLLLSSHYKTHKIKIGNQNWFGSNVVILSKTKVGDKNVIGAGVILNETVGSHKIITSRPPLKITDIVYKC